MSKILNFNYAGMVTNRGIEFQDFVKILSEKNLFVISEVKNKELLEELNKGAEDKRWYYAITYNKINYEC